MSAKWENVKKTVKDTLSSAAATTKKFTRIGKVRLGKMRINKSIDNTYRKLGKEVYDQVSGGMKGDVSNSKKVKNQIVQGNQLKKSIKNKDEEIATIKKESALPSETN